MLLNSVGDSPAFHSDGSLATVCVPPKAGSEAAHRAFPGTRLEWIGDGVAGNVRASAHPNDPAARSDGSHAKIERWLRDADRVRVAIVRHPVERLLSAMRAFGVHDVCPSCVRREMKVARTAASDGVRETFGGRVPKVLSRPDAPF